jgi:hypothetical protein
MERSHLKTLPCICLHYLTQVLVGIIGRSHLKTLPCICLRYLTQALLGMFRAIAPENLTLYLFTLSHSSITRN